MPVTKTFGPSLAIPDHPDRLGPSLAHILWIEGDRESVLGQAWIAGHNALITCGHVVEQFVASPSSLVVRFPASGNCYAVQGIRLHPSFVRQPDGLVKFDVALLNVAMAHPETQSSPLPFSFERDLRSNQPLAAVRYPTHLSQLTATPQPLAQEGRFLGHLRKHDNFHLLHDLALSPGDSGAAIFDGWTVVAVHCGDTATLPGLNLPTTSIRLALWVDALRELGLAETFRPLPVRQARPLLSLALTFLAALLIAAVAAGALIFPAIKAQWGIEQPHILPVDISFNKPLNRFTEGDNVEIVLVPRSDCWLYLFDVDEKNRVLKLYPPYGFPAFVRSGQARTIDRFGRKLLKVNRAKDKLHVIALNSDFPLVTNSDWDPFDPAGNPLVIDGNQLLERMEGFQKADPRNVVHVLMDAPTAQ